MLPELYHAHHQIHMEDLPFWEELARQAQPPILELGCGTGRLLIQLARSHERLIGLDNDQAMLKFLQNQLTPSGLTGFELVQADLTNFHFSEKFGLIFLACNTLSTLTSAQRHDLYERLLEHLLPAGIFVASIPNPALLMSLPAFSEPEVEDSFTLPESDEPVQVSSAWKRLDDRLIFYWYYDRLFSDGRVERYQIQVAHYLQSKSTYLGELNRAGLQVTALFGDYDRSAYRRGSPQLILVASPRL